MSKKRYLTEWVVVDERDFPYEMMTKEGEVFCDTIFSDREKARIVQRIIKAAWPGKVVTIKRALIRVLKLG